MKGSAGPKVPQLGPKYSRNESSLHDEAEADVSQEGSVTPVVRDDREKGRLSVEQDGDEAELVYEINGDRLVLWHTGVPESLEGRGIGGELVRAAVRRGAEDNLTVVPSCPFARRWLKEHPDTASTVSIDWTR